METTAEWIGPALLAVPLFVSTNADDLVLLAIFFSHPRARAVSIVFGQLAGIALLTAASVVAARLAVRLPPTWIPLLGVIPIYLGLRQIFSKSDDENDGPVSPSNSAWTVTAVTIANGGDNLGVYIPVFASQSIAGIGVIAVMFLVFTLAWCALASGVVNHPRWGQQVRAAATRFGPYVLIAVGLWIVSEHPVIADWMRG